MTKEPLHDTVQDAISWVHANTDNKIFRSSHFSLENRATIRVDAGGTVMILREDLGSKFYWERMREVD